MSWHFSQALEAAFSAANCSGGNACAPSSATPTHGTFWSPDKTTDASPRSRSGMMYAPSTGSLGADVLTWCLAASPARTSAPQGAAKESPGSEADSGWKWPESSVKFDPASRSWKTRQCSLLGDLEPASGTWPRWGIMRDGESWELSTPALLTSGRESGYWPTPRTTGLDGGSNSRKAAKARGMWPTIRAADGERGGRGDLIQAIRGNENSHYKLWPTPCASEARQGLQIRREGKKGSQQSLSTAVVFATPQARDYRTGSTDRWENPERSRNLNDQIGGQLNPNWVAWLMGWPIEWTACAASATDKFRQWCASHGISSDRL
jgi:hypothetical protein